MSHPNPSTALARVIVDELVLQGVGEVVIAPGSRSGALAIAAAESPDVESVVMIDERSAAFRALGSTKAGRRAAVISTSGTATANMFPAVVEADMSCEALVVVTADRPFDMRGVGANQTIIQTNLYGPKTRASIDIDAPGEDLDLNTEWRFELARALGAGAGPRPGPVHINVGFREPTVPVADDGRSNSAGYPYETPRLPDKSPAKATAGKSTIIPSGRGVIVAGDGRYDRHELARRAHELGWPVLATAMSSMRGPNSITTYHHMLAGNPTDLRPEVVVVVGAVGPSPVLERFISSVPHQLRVDRWGRVNDPNRTATEVLTCDVLDLLTSASSAEPTWQQAWREADAAMRSSLIVGLENGGVTGGAVVHALNEVEMGALVVGSSLPIREVDAHFTEPVPVFGNRGASGIDGFVSTAAGVADVIGGTVGLCGDLSLLHDSNGFLSDPLPDMVLVVLDNNGGGLFDSLPQAQHAPSFERLFATPPDRDIEMLTRFHGVGFFDAKSMADFGGVLTEAMGEGGVSVVRVVVDRVHDLAIRTRLGH